MRIYKVFQAPSGGRLYQSEFPQDTIFYDENGDVKIDHLYCLSYRTPWHGEFQTNVYAFPDSRVIDPKRVRKISIEIKKYLDDAKNVLVHCDQGWNRSGLINARTMMYYDMNYLTAMDQIRQLRHPMALSNIYFIQFLQDEQLRKDLYS